MYRVLRQTKAALVLLLVLSLLGAEFVSMAHNITVRHVYCLAHGHLVDADEAETHRGHFISGNQNSDALPEIERAEGEAPHHRHIHCDKTVFLKSGSIPPNTFIISNVLLAHECPAGRLPAAPDKSSLALLLAAPKHSPPHFS